MEKLKLETKAYYSSKNAERGARLLKAENTVASGQAAYWASIMAQEKIKDAQKLLEQMDSQLNALAPDLLFNVAQFKKGKTDGRILLKQQKLSIHLPSPQGPSGNPCSIVSPPFISLLAKTSSALFTSTNSKRTFIWIFSITNHVGIKSWTFFSVSSCSCFDTFHNFSYVPNPLRFVHCFNLITCMKKSFNGFVTSVEDVKNYY